MEETAQKPKVEPLPSKPMATPPPGAPQVAVAPTSPPGWWALSNIRGAKGAVISKIDSTPGLPDHWKTVLKAEVDARCSGDLNFVYLDAHFYLESGKAVLHMTISPLAMLV